jgi:hypothetical protein
MAPLQCSLHAQRKPQARRCVWVRSFLVIAAVPCWFVLAGCSTALVQPKAETSAGPPTHRYVPARKLRALLAPQTPPNCDYMGPENEGLDADLWAQIKLDYEKQCYQRAEARVRRRLHQLQSGVRELRPVAHRERFIRAVPAL